MRRDEGEGNFGRRSPKPVGDEQLPLTLRGRGKHRFIGIWFVIVERRVFVRSWSIRPDGWYQTFIRQPRGAIRIKKSEIAVRALPVRSGRLLDSIDRAYLDRYHTPWTLKYANDLCQPTSRATTTELVPGKSPASRSAEPMTQF